MNTLWCYLSYKLVGDDGATGKCLYTFAIDAQKGQTMYALLDKNFPGIPSTDNKPTPYITTEIVTYIFALVIDSVTIYHTDSLVSHALQQGPHPGGGKRGPLQLKKNPLRHSQWVPVGRSQCLSGELSVGDSELQNTK